MRCLQVLVIDDEPALRQIMSNVIEKAGHSVATAENGTEALERLAKGDIDVALCDIRMPDMTGLEVVAKSREAGIDTVFIMMTAFASVNTAIEAMRSGAYDYMIKPVRNEDLLNRLGQVSDVIGLKSENKMLRGLVMDGDSVHVQTLSPAMKKLEHLIRKVALTDSTVLITGESGTGKGVTARMIHKNSTRSNNQFVAVNCGAIPENLLESEFLGHTKGAFTGAHKAKRGLFVEADQGTIFLDEIGELPLAMQVKLLHVIEDRIVRAVGSEQSRKVNVRIIAATNRDLAKMVQEGTFREDLYFRLNIFNLEIPPLRKRKEDIPALLNHFISKEAAKMGITSPFQVEPEVVDVLSSYQFPGNVRELENIVARAIILAEDDLIRVEDLPDHIPSQSDHSGKVGMGSGTGTLKDQVRMFEINVINRTIEESGGDRKLAAKQLGLGLSSLYRKLEEV